MRVEAIRKTYKIKNAQSIVALDGVSFDLPKNGMVFILGKSGSGKSTLLNIMSGLDKVDEGKIEFCGKDITKLTEKELSNYRNSCCGFVFQEYNLIPELDVGENIMLTLQLQREKDTEQKVKEVLKQVDLVGYEKRKVTELSGGQKQRVAIARAIIKNPKIIFADEPTGALDEKTGRNIFDLLKEFSKDKLVIVVSHDRACAERYGDRIIELADGKIVADNGTVEFPQEIKEEEWKKPKLPNKTAMKIGCSNFRYHPIRFLASILLSVIAFTFLGISLNIAFNRFQDIVFNSMQSNHVKYGVINKYYKDNLVIPIKESEKQSIEKEIGTSFCTIDTTIDIQFANMSEYVYYSVVPNGFAEISSDLITRFGFSFNGRLPNAQNELGVTKFMADIIKNLCYSEEQDKNIIGNYLRINEQDYLITAIIDTCFDFEKYSALKKTLINTKTNLTEAFSKEVNSSLHNYFFVNNITNFCREEISMDKETCAIYLSNNFSIAISELIKPMPSYNVYTLNDIEKGSFISANLIPIALQLFECDIEYNNKVFSNYGELFRTLCNENSEEDADIDGNFYIEIYERYKDKYLFPTSFSCSFVDKKYSLRYDNIIISGFYSGCNCDSVLIVPNEVYQFFYEEIGGEYDNVFVSVDNDKVKHYISQNDVFRLNNYIVENVSRYWDTFDTIKAVAYILSGIFAFFSIGLLLNFMMLSVVDKTKVIGILKANGCNNVLLSKIFITEGIIMAFTTFVFVTLLVLVICLFLSKSFISFAFLGVNILIFPILLTIILLFSIIGCLVPIVHMRQRVPNDIILKS